MIPQWIDNNTFIGPFWMGTPKQIAETQAAIHEECDFYEDESAHDDLEWLEDEYVPELDGVCHFDTPLKGE